MFDYNIKILPNGRVLIRDTASKVSEVLRPDQVSAYFENALEGQMKAQEKQDIKVSKIKKQLK